MTVNGNLYSPKYDGYAQGLNYDIDERIHVAHLIIDSIVSSQITLVDAQIIDGRQFFNLFKSDSLLKIDKRSVRIACRKPNLALSIIDLFYDIESSRFRVTAPRIFNPYHHEIQSALNELKNKNVKLKSPSIGDILNVFTDITRDQALRDEVEFYWHHLIEKFSERCFQWRDINFNGVLSQRLELQKERLKSALTIDSSMDFANEILREEVDRNILFKRLKELERSGAHLDAETISCWYNINYNTVARMQHGCDMSDHSETKDCFSSTVEQDIFDKYLHEFRQGNKIDELSRNTILLPDEIIDPLFEWNNVRLEHFISRPKNIRAKKLWTELQDFSSLRDLLHELVIELDREFGLSTIERRRKLYNRAFSVVTVAGAGAGFGIGALFSSSFSGAVFGAAATEAAKSQLTTMLDSTDPISRSLVSRYKV